MTSKISLKDIIIKSFSDISLDTNRLSELAEDPKKSVSWSLFAACDNEEKETQTLVFEVRVSGKPFDWQDGELKVTQAVVDFEIVIRDCPYDYDTKTFTWNDSLKPFPMVTPARANVDTYYHNEWLIAERDCFYSRAKGLIDTSDIDDDHDITEAVGKMVISNTSQDKLNEFCKIMVSQTQF